LTQDAGDSRPSAIRSCRKAFRLGLLSLLASALLATASTPARGAYLHTTVVGEYGKEGPKATGLGTGCRIGWHAATQRLYLYSDTKIYGLQRTGTGTVTPLAGGFPIALPGIQSSCGDRDLGVDNSATGSAGNIYVTPSNPPNIYGYNSSGAALASPWPINVGTGENCGVAVGNNGDVFAGYYSGSSIKQYSSAGAPIATIPFGQNICKLEVDPSNNDLFGIGYSSNNIFKLTAGSGYATKVNFPSAGTSNPGLAVNGVQNRLYVASGTTVKALDADSGAVVETITPGGSVLDVAVDEATDTVFTSGGGVIKEITGAIVPDITTGSPEGNSKVTGKVEPAGGGNVTECYFEWGNPGGPAGSYTLGKEFCSPATPYSGNQEVFANLPGLLGEQTYHYRLVAANANGKNFGGDQTITPHYVEGLTTDDAENVTRTGAKLKAHFTGNGEETKYYFEWGPTTSYGTKSAAPPGDSAGSPTGLTNLSHEVSGLAPDTLYHYRIVATNPKGVSPGNDKTFKSLPAVQSLVTQPATNVKPRSATLNGSYNGDGTATTYFYEYGTTVGYGSTTPMVNVGSPSGATPLPANVSGLELDTLYHYRVVATNALGTTKGADQTFTTKKAVENLVTKPATEITEDSVTLNAEFEGTGLDTNYYFEYGPTTAYGTLTAEPPGDDAGITNGATPLSKAVTKFQGYTMYHYRVVAVNSLGTTAGADQTFTTLPAPLPEIGATGVSDIHPTGATLAAELNPHRWATVYLFEYGPTDSYGSMAGTEILDGQDNDSHSVSAALNGLAPATTYHFRVVATNFTGTSHSADQTFTTPDLPRIDRSAVSAVGQASVHLSAAVSGNASPTEVTFEYGTSELYGQSTAPIPVGEGLTSQSVETDVGGLSPGLTYHARAVASNGVGTTNGPDLTFRTQPVLETVRPKEPVRCRKGFVKRHGKCVKRKHRRKHRRQQRQRSVDHG
jgi:hypothetical protein